MKILLDHCVPRRLGPALAGHDVATAAELGWHKLRNGKLLLAAAADGYDVLLTVDRNLKHQQNLAALPVSVVVLVAKSNALPDLLPLVPLLDETLSRLTPRTLVEVVQPPA